MSGEKESADEAERALIEASILAEGVNEANHTDPPADLALCALDRRDEI